MSGLFITLEGTDGSGKTTQINRLKEYFSERGYRVVCTREPGGTPIGEKIREIIIDKNNSEMANITEALLYAAARAQLVNEVIEPVLKDGGVVISDRFLDSSLVYQGFARGMGENFIKNINRAGVNSLEPDITFLWKLKPEDSIARKSKQAELDRLEAEKANFHQRVFDGYISLARRNKERIKIIDALKTEEDIHNEILNHIESFMKKRGF